jgi:hypothetical protein
MASPEQRPPAPEEHAREDRRRDARRRVLAFALVFAAAFGVRLLCWRDVRFEAYKVQTAVTENYRQLARLLLENGASPFYDPASPTSEPDLLGHSPGYPFVLAAVYAVFGGSDAAVQIFQAACDALAAALVFLRENPVWFAGVMLRRAGSMLRLERTPLSSNAPVSEGWTRAPRIILRAIQKIFITAVFLPLYLAGLVLLLRERRKRELVALLTVPLYFLCVQSALHTEYRYVLAVHYFLFVVAAAALHRAWLAARGAFSKSA